MVKESFCVKGSQGGLDSLVERGLFFFMNSHLYTFDTIHDRKQEDRVGTTSSLLLHWRRLLERDRPIERCYQKVGQEGIIDAISKAFWCMTARSSLSVCSSKQPTQACSVSGMLEPFHWLFVGALDTVDHISSRRISSGVTYSYLVAGMT
jgi:hypothetical protein